MKFSTKEDIEAPIDAVFDMLCDVEAFERLAMRRGADVRRREGPTGAALGLTWDVSFDLRGRRRDLVVEITRFERPTEMVAEANSTNFSGAMTLELLALSRTRTRMMVALDIRPQNLSARLLIQSFKLAKTSLTKKYKLRVAEYAKTLEERYKRVA